MSASRAPSVGWKWLALVLLAGLATWLPVSALLGATGCRRSEQNLLAALVVAVLATAAMTLALHRFAKQRWGRSLAVSAAAGGVAALLLALATVGMGSLEHRKLSRTMHDIRRYATIIEGYSIEHGRYPEGLTAIELGARMGLRDPVLRDAWGTPIEIAVKGNCYVVRSAGLCGEFETADPWMARGRTDASSDDPRNDIVFNTGAFYESEADAHLGRNCWPSRSR